MICGLATKQDIDKLKAEIAGLRTLLLAKTEGFENSIEGLKLCLIGQIDTKKKSRKK